MELINLEQELRKGTIKVTEICGKDFIVISTKHFDKYLTCFGKPLKLGSKLNFRSTHFMKHIHAVRDIETTEIHIDNGNMYKFFPLGLLHLFIDVIPYFYWMVINKRKPYDF